MKRRRKRPLLWIIVILLIGGAGLYYSGLLSPAAGNKDADPEATSSAKGLIINEVVTSNQYSFADETGYSPDWIELYNGTGSSVNLSGYGLSKDPDDPMQFKFPNVTINNGQYLLVFAAGKDDPAAEKLLSTGFRLSQDGETLVLSNPDETLIQKLEVGSMPSDMSYGMTKGGVYGYFSAPTPGNANADEYNTVPEFLSTFAASDLKINEVMPDNKDSIMDMDGERHAWVEIVNTGAQSINLDGYALSDNASDRKKWVFPAIELAPGEMKIVFLSGKNIADVSEPHANFGLALEEHSLFLSNPQGILIDVAQWVYRYGNVSIGRDINDSGRWLYFGSPTPGRPNTTKGFEEIDKNTERILPS